MMGDAWRQDSRARWARSTSQGDSGIFSESKLLVKPDGGDEQSTQSATRDTRQKHGIVSVEREGVIPRVVREIFSLSQRLFEASTSASRTPLSPLLGKENIIQDVETQRATSSSTCSPPVSWGTDGDGGGGDKSKNASIDSFGVRVNERSLTRRLLIEQSGCLDLRQQCKEGKRRGNSATDAGSSKRVQENDRSTSPSPSCMVECSYIQVGYEDDNQTFLRVS